MNCGVERVFSVSGRKGGWAVRVGRKDQGEYHYADLGGSVSANVVDLDIMLSTSIPKRKTTSIFRRQELEYAPLYIVGCFQSWRQLPAVGRGLHLIPEWSFSI